MLSPAVILLFPQTFRQHLLLLLLMFSSFNAHMKRAYKSKHCTLLKIFLCLRKSFSIFKKASELWMCHARLPFSRMHVGWGENVPMYKRNVQILHPIFPSFPDYLSKPSIFRNVWLVHYLLECQRNNFMGKNWLSVEVLNALQNH